MNRSELLEKLGEIEVLKAKLLKKLAQTQHSVLPDPQHVAPKHIEVDEPKLILNELYARFPNARKAVAALEVRGSKIIVKFFKGMENQAALNAVVKVTETLAGKNLLNFPQYEVIQGTL